MFQGIHQNTDMRFSIGLYRIAELLPPWKLCFIEKVTV